MIKLKNSAMYISFLVMIHGNFYAIIPENPIVVIDKTSPYARQSKLGYAITVINNMGEKPVRGWFGRTLLSAEMSNVVHFMKIVADHINFADQSEQSVIAQWPKNHFLLQEHFSISSSTLFDELRFMDIQQLSSFATACETIQKIVHDFTLASVLKRVLQERIVPQDKEIAVDVRKPLLKLCGEEQKLNKIEQQDNQEQLDNIQPQGKSWSIIIKPSLLCIAAMIAIYYCYSQHFFNECPTEI
jgi:hypothetical protein